jgi:hypothetical protein
VQLDAKQQQLDHNQVCSHFCCVKIVCDGGMVREMSGSVASPLFLLHRIYTLVLSHRIYAMGQTRSYVSSRSGGVAVERVEGRGGVW